MKNRIFITVGFIVLASYLYLSTTSSTVARIISKIDLPYSSIANHITMYLPPFTLVLAFSKVRDRLGKVLFVILGVIFVLHNLPSMIFKVFGESTDIAPAPSVQDIDMVTEKYNGKIYFISKNFKTTAYHSNSVTSQEVLNDLAQNK